MHTFLIWQVFVEMDTDDSGTLSLTEFRQAMEQHPEVPPAQARQPKHR